MKTIDIDLIRSKLSSCCFQYEKTAPVVSRWADELYMTLSENASLVTVWELMVLDKLDADGEWINANYAQNMVYKCMDSLNKNTSGILDH